MKYSVSITETLQKFIEVEADSRDEAEETAEREWKDSKHVLDVDDFTDVSFIAIEEDIETPESPKSKANDGYER